MDSLALIKPAIAIACGLLALSSIRRHLGYVWSLKDLPQPPVPSFLAGHSLDVRKARVGTRYSRWTHRYGCTYKLRGPLLEPLLIMGDPKGASYVLTKNASNFPRPEIDRIVLESWFGNGLFCAEGEEHKRQRRMLNPAFSNQSVEEVSHIFYDLAYQLVDKWETMLDGKKSSAFDIAATIHVMTMDAISMTMFAYNCSATEPIIPELLQRFTNAPDADDGPTVITTLFGALVSKFPRLLNLIPTPMKRWADELQLELGGIAYRVLREGLGSSRMDAKILKLLDGQSRGGPQAGLTGPEAIAQIIGILFAGSETVANMISEMLLELARQPRIQDKLRQELLDFERRNGRQPNFQDLSNPNTLPYLEACTRETLRLKAVLMAEQDDVIPLQYPILGTDLTHVHVKAGQAINIPVRDGINVDPQLWGDDAQVFRPERWVEPNGLPEGALSIRAQDHTLTFGDGPKVCLGRIFALTELQIVVSVMLLRFRFEDAGMPLDFYHLGGNTVKPKIRGRESEGVQLPLKVHRL
ncbi:cytochrome P450 [Punctularia strigosozonata HHB-11173 SS5]|uniref:cytochrome P450 n=1 Tax=Punctularia strigosozonata (strain HHB-11173) TaxID=741275 RepID=UPI0004417438|nr:cytochrome P450 [Punctularia strigosozonata HHB-11173 SS5]EIN08588.1 cytochrome P450 [Punctularia strigosozonata HHB-11173 SS5]